MKILRLSLLPFFLANLLFTEGTDQFSTITETSNNLKGVTVEKQVLVFNNETGIESKSHLVRKDIETDGQNTSNYLLSMNGNGTRGLDPIFQDKVNLKKLGKKRKKQKSNRTRRRKNRLKKNKAAKILTLGEPPSSSSDDTEMWEKLAVNQNGSIQTSSSGIIDHLEGSQGIKDLNSTTRGKSFKRKKGRDKRRKNKQNSDSSSSISGKFRELDNMFSKDVKPRRTKAKGRSRKEGKNFALSANDDTGSKIGESTQDLSENGSHVDINNEKILGAIINVNTDKKSKNKKRKKGKSDRRKSKKKSRKNSTDESSIPRLPSSDKEPLLAVLLPGMSSNKGSRSMGHFKTRKSSRKPEVTSFTKSDDNDNPLSVASTSNMTLNPKISHEHPVPRQSFQSILNLSKSLKQDRSLTGSETQPALDQLPSSQFSQKRGLLHFFPQLSNNKIAEL